MITFKKGSDLYRHMVAHVITPDESHAWYLIWRGAFAILNWDPASLEQCYRLRCDVLGEDSDREQLDETYPARELEQAYLQTIAESFRSSERLQWYCEGSGRRVTLDENGVFCAFDVGEQNRVRTAFIPGCASKEGTIRARTDPSDPHARVVRRSRARGDDDGPGRRPREPSLRERLAHDRYDKWTEDERIYYLVFRPAVQFIYAYQRQVGGSIPDMLDLKRQLPPRSRLKLEHWLAMRATQGGEHG